MHPENRLIISGAITRNGVLRYSPQGLAYVGLTLAGRSNGRTWFAPLKLFGTDAERYAEAAGETIKVAGRLDFDEWSTAEGKRNITIEVQANSITDLELATGRFDNGNFYALEGENQATLAGHLTADSKLNNTVTTFRMGVNSGTKASFFKVAKFEATPAIGKGTAVIVTGRVENNTWKDANGNPASAVSIVAQTIETKERQPRNPPATLETLNVVAKPVVPVEAAPAPVEAPTAPRATKTGESGKAAAKSTRPSKITGKSKTAQAIPG